MAGFPMMMMKRHGRMNSIIGMHEQCRELARPLLELNHPLIAHLGGEGAQPLA